MSFRVKNIWRHKASSFLGVLICLLTLAIMTYFVYVGKATVEGIFPYYSLIVPVLLAFLFYGKKDDAQTPKP